MMPSVFSSCMQAKVVDSIVCFISVFMMDNFIASKFPIEVLFHYIAMFKNIPLISIVPPRHVKANIAAESFVSTALPVPVFFFYKSPLHAESHLFNLTWCRLHSKHGMFSVAPSTSRQGMAVTESPDGTNGYLHGFGHLFNRQRFFIKQFLKCVHVYFRVALRHKFNYSCCASRYMVAYT